MGVFLQQHPWAPLPRAAALAANDADIDGAAESAAAPARESDGWRMQVNKDTSTRVLLGLSENEWFPTANAMGPPSQEVIVKVSIILLFFRKIRIIFVSLCIFMFKKKQHNQNNTNTDVNLGRLLTCALRPEECARYRQTPSVSSAYNPLDVIDNFGELVARPDLWR